MIYSLRSPISPISPVAKLNQTAMIFSDGRTSILGGDDDSGEFGNPVETTRHPNRQSRRPRKCVGGE